MPSLLGPLSRPQTSPSWNPSTLFLVRSNAKSSSKFYGSIDFPSQPRSRVLTFVINSLLPSNGNFLYQGTNYPLSQSFMFPCNLLELTFIYNQQKKSSTMFHQAQVNGNSYCAKNTLVYAHISLQNTIHVQKVELDMVHLCQLLEYWEGAPCTISREPPTNSVAPSINS